MSRVDEYAAARARLRSTTKAEAMKRLWAMAQEALEVRARMGVATLSYTTDLIPGVEDCRIRATEREVVIDLRGVDWGRGQGQQFAESADRKRYRIDEAWLLGVASIPD